LPRSVFSDAPASSTSTTANAEYFAVVALDWEPDYLYVAISLFVLVVFTVRCSWFDRWLNIGSEAGSEL
jgi:hypothetical protein